MDGKCGHQLQKITGCNLCVILLKLCNLARQWRQLHITSHIFFGGHSLAGAETALLLECCSKNWAATPCRLGSRKQGPKCSLEVVLYQCTMTRIPLYHVVSNLLKRIVANIIQHLLTRYFLDNRLFWWLELNWCGLNPSVMNISSEVSVLPWVHAHGHSGDAAMGPWKTALGFASQLETYGRIAWLVVTGTWLDYDFP